MVRGGRHTGAELKGQKKFPQQENKRTSPCRGESGPSFNDPTAGFPLKWTAKSKVAGTSACWQLGSEEIFSIGRGSPKELKSGERMSG